MAPTVYPSDIGYVAASSLHLRRSINSAYDDAYDVHLLNGNVVGTRRLVADRTEDLCVCVCVCMLTICKTASNIGRPVRVDADCGAITAKSSHLVGSRQGIIMCD